jgi:hypothetical protein
VCVVGRFGGRDYVVSLGVECEVGEGVLEVGVGIVGGIGLIGGVGSRQ